LSTLPNKELLRPDEVAVYFSVTVRTVRRWIGEGKLKAVRVFGVTRIPRKEVVRAQKVKDGL
jgi:excisionase family DNA binding protein